MSSLVSFSLFIPFPSSMWWMIAIWGAKDQLQFLILSGGSFFQLRQSLMIAVQLFLAAFFVIHFRLPQFS